MELKKNMFFIRAPRILIFSIAMGADYSFDVKNIDIWASAFFWHNNSFIATALEFLLNAIHFAITYLNLNATKSSG